MQLKTLLKAFSSLVKEGNYREIPYSGNLKEESMYRKKQWCSECQEFTIQTWYEVDGDMKKSYLQCSKCGTSWYLRKGTSSWDSEVPYELQEEEVLVR